mgnify:CR=1 FL=1
MSDLATLYRHRQLIAALTAVLLVARADPLEQDRKQYQEIRTAQEAGKITSLRQIPASLEDYPLYPYLVYSHLRPRLAGARGAPATGPPANRF